MNELGGKKIHDIPVDLGLHSQVVPEHMIEVGFLDNEQMAPLDHLYGGRAGLSGDNAHFTHRGHRFHRGHLQTLGGHDGQCARKKDVQLIAGRVTRAYVILGLVRPGDTPAQHRVDLGRRQAVENRNLFEDLNQGFIRLGRYRYIPFIF